MKYIPEKIQAHELKDETLESCDMSKIVIHVNAGAPAKTDDTGLGYNQGTIWIDSTNGDMYVCSDHSAENATWLNMEGDDVNLFLYQANSKIGRSGGCRDPSPTYQSTHIQMMSVASEGDSADIGETSPSLGVKGWQTGCAKDGYPASYVYWYGGITTTPGNSPTDEMVRHGISSPATLADIGEIGNKHAFGGTACNSSNWFVWGGGGGATSISPPFTTQIEKVTFASPASTSDSGGDLATDIAHFGAHTDLVNSRAYQTGGEVGSGPTEVDTLAYFSLGISSGNETDYGEASYATHKMGSSTSTTHAYHFGSHSPFTDLIEKYPMTAPTSNTDVGNLLQGMYEGGGASAPTVSYQIGGATYPPNASLDQISKFSTASDANATDVGETTETVHGAQGNWTD